MSGGGPDGEALSVLVEAIPEMGASGEFPWWSARPLLSVDARLAPYPQRRQELALALLLHPEAEIRKEAAGAAGAICRDRRGPDHLLAPALGDLLADPNAEVREAAAHTLAELGPAAGPAREPLLAVLESGSNPQTRAFAAWALSKLREPRAAPGIVRVLEETEDGDKAEVPVFVTALEAARRLGPLADAAVPVLRRLLASGGEAGQVRQRAAAALGEIGPAAHVALPDLVAALQRPDVAYSAASALARWGSAAAPAVPALCDLLRHADVFLRRVASEALGSIIPGAGPAAPALEAALADPDGNVRAHAALALWRITGRADLAIPPLVHILEGIRTKQEVRAAGSVAAEHLGLIGPPAREALPALRAALDYPSHWVQVHAARGLWRVGGEGEAALPVLRRHLRADPAGLLVLECLSEMGPRALAAAPDLRPIVESERRLLEVGSHQSWIEEDEAFRAAAARALARIEGAPEPE